jgi:DNA-directed RNA polymerase
LDIVDKIWNTGGGFAEIPTRTDIPIPRNASRRVVKEIQQKNNDLHSLRSDMLLKLELAKRYVGQKFYMPHNIDFRGRAYPMPPHLNHLGSDMSRGLLLFHEGRPLGKNGLRWLKIHLANLCGKDKLSQDQRVQFVDSMMSLIKDSAEKPLAGYRWWLEAEEPWQVRKIFLFLILYFLVLLSLLLIKLCGFSAWLRVLKWRTFSRVKTPKSSFLTCQFIAMELAMDSNTMRP